VDELAVSTVVYLPPEEVYEFLLDFPGYARYSKHLKRVRQRGDGSPGTQYRLEFSWWKLSYTAHSEVTDVDPPARIDWRVLKDIDAHGRWLVEEVPLPEDAPSDAETASRVRLEIAFDRSSADKNAVDIPAFVSFDWVLGKLKPLVRREAERVVERIVADIEGRRRPVEVEIHENDV
jgi:uncharacterized membrane protein